MKDIKEIHGRYEGGQEIFPMIFNNQPKGLDMGLIFFPVDGRSTERDSAWKIQERRGRSMRDTRRRGVNTWERSRKVR
jgi:hypothetical protein